MQDILHPYLTLQNHSHNTIRIPLEHPSGKWDHMLESSNAGQLLPCAPHSKGSLRSSSEVPGKSTDDVTATMNHVYYNSVLFSHGKNPR